MAYMFIFINAMAFGVLVLIAFLFGVGTLAKHFQTGSYTYIKELKGA